MRTVLLLGATGLIGRHTLPLLLADETVGKVLVLARRPTGVAHAKLEEQPFDFTRVRPVDQVICALGTTMRVAKTKETFREVDHDYPLLAAKRFRETARHYILVSSAGANPDARFFYPRVKGETERDLIAVGYPSTTILRPSFLTGDRDEFRLGEQIVTRLGWLMPRSMKPIAAETVALAIAALAREQRPGVQILESAAIAEAARLTTHGA